MTLKANMRPEEAAARIQRALDLPLHHFFNLEVLDYGPGTSKVRINPTPNIINPSNVIHGGVIYSTLDFAAFVSVMILLKETQNVVTHDIHVSVMRPGPMKQPILLEGRVAKMGQRIAFCDATAWTEDKLLASARVTKSIIESPEFPIIPL